MNIVNPRNIHLARHEEKAAVFGVLDRLGLKAVGRAKLGAKRLEQHTVRTTGEHLRDGKVGIFLNTAQGWQGNGNRHPCLCGIRCLKDKCRRCEIRARWTDVLKLDIGQSGHQGIDNGAGHVGIDIARKCNRGAARKTRGMPFTHVIHSHRIECFGAGETCEVQQRSGWQNVTAQHFARQHSLLRSGGSKIGLDRVPRAIEPGDIKGR